MNKVCAVIVTFNRKELLMRNINSLLKQTYPVDILIYDNASTDGTFHYLQENKIIEKTNVKYYLAESNTGGSGGFCYGAQIAVKKGMIIFGSWTMMGIVLMSLLWKNL